MRWSELTENMPPSEQVRLMLLEWGRLMATDPLFYLPVNEDIATLRARFPITDPRNRQHYDDIDSFVERRIALRQVLLATSGPDYDSTLRVPSDQINTMYIHHTEGPANVTLRRLSVFGLLGQWVPWFAENQRVGDPELDKGRDMYGLDITRQPIWSNHFMQTPQGIEQHFIAYPWVVSSNRGPERVMTDTALPAATPGLNKASTAVVLNGTFNEESLTPVIQGLLDQIITIHQWFYRDRIPADQILGHTEATGLGNCPGPWWFNGGKDYIVRAVKSLTPPPRTYSIASVAIEPPPKPQK